MRRSSWALILLMAFTLALPRTGLAAVAVDARLKKIAKHFEDARVDLRKGRQVDAMKDLQKTINYFQDIREGRGEKAEGRAWKMMGNSIAEIEALQRRIGNDPGFAEKELLPVYQNALNSLAEHVRKAGHNPTGKLIRRQDVAFMTQKLISDFLQK